MIRIRSVSKQYGTTKAVQEISLEIQKGEVVGLLGQNGAGKTTLMKMVTGFLEPSSGSITINDLDIVDQRLEAQRLIGYLPEHNSLYPEMLVQEYLFMMADLRKIPKEAQQQAVIDAVKATDLKGYLTKPIAHLSKGYKQRVGLAQAILHKPPLLILDEPTNGLDPLQIESIRRLILDLSKTTTIILSTHILQEVEAVCDRVLILIDGQLVADEPLQHLLQSNTIRITVQGEDVEHRLRSLEGIESVSRQGQDESFPDFEVWNLTYTGTYPVPRILSQGAQWGWIFYSIGQEKQNLQHVFQKLQQQRIHSV